MFYVKEEVYLFSIAPEGTVCKNQLFKIAWKKFQATCQEKFPDYD